MNAWFLSDLHLKDPKERNSQTCLRFFNSLVNGQREASHVILLGDIFDVWVSGHKIFIEKWSELISPLVALRQRGVQIIYVEGNHDMHLKPFWQNKLGAQVYHEIEYLNLGPWTVRIEHGDLINQQDLAYLKYRKFVRSLPIKFLAHVLPGNFWNHLGERASQKSRQYSSKLREQDRALQPEEQDQSLKEMFRQYSECAHSEKEFDFMISGHLHVQDEYQFSVGAKKVTSVNLGSWFDSPKVYHLTVESGQFETLENIFNSPANQHMSICRGIKNT